MRWRTLALAAALLVYPFVLPGPFYRDMGVLVLLQAISASSWNIVGGYAGQVSVGHAAFFGAGAYLPVLFYRLWKLPLLVGLPAGIAVSLVIAVVIGLPSFRLRGHYFSMATFAAAELVRLSVSTSSFLGGAIGMMGPATPRGWWDLVFRSSLPYYYLFLAVLAVVLFTTWQMQRTRLGYYLRAIGGDERASRSLGVPVNRYKLYAFLLSAGFTSVAGSLYVIKTGFIDPGSGFGFLISVQMIIVAALGGAGTLLGPLLGAVILVPLQTATNTWFGGGATGLTFIVYGGIIMLIARFEPGGLIELWRLRIAPFFRHRGGSAHAS